MLILLVRPYLAFKTKVLYRRSIFNHILIAELLPVFKPILIVKFVLLNIIEPALIFSEGYILKFTEFNQ